MALTFVLSQPCTAGNHFNVTVQLDGAAATFPSSFDELEQPLTELEREELSRLLLKFLVSRLVIKTSANARAKLAAANIPLRMD